MPIKKIPGNITRKIMNREEKLYLPGNKVRQKISKGSAMKTDNTITRDTQEQNLSEEIAASLGLLKSMTGNTNTLSMIQKLAMMAFTDSLTGLAARNYFENRLNEEIIDAGLNMTPFSVVVFDIDFFKNINDTYGHETGDRVLVELAELTGHQTGSIKELRENEQVYARLGGDEFAILLPETSRADAEKLIDSLKRKIDNKLFTNKNIKVECSFGIAVFPPHGVTAKELLHAADTALYKAKQTGRNRIIAV